MTPGAFRARACLRQLSNGGGGCVGAAGVQETARRALASVSRGVRGAFVWVLPACRRRRSAHWRALAKGCVARARKGAGVHIEYHQGHATLLPTSTGRAQMHQNTVWRWAQGVVVAGRRQLSELTGMAFRLAVAAPFDHPAFSSTGGTARQGTAFWKGSTREQQTWRAHRARSTVGDVRLWEPSMAAGRRESEKAQLKKNRLLAWARQLREQRPIVPLGKGMRGTSGLAIAGGRAVGDAPVAETCEKPFGPALKALAAACKYEYLAISSNLQTP